MTIAENLHMAFLRTSPVYPHVTLKGDRIEQYRAKIGRLEMQLEDRLDNLIGSLSGGQRQAITLLMGRHGPAQGPAPGRTHGRPGPSVRQTGGGAYQKVRGPGQADHPDGHPQHAARPLELGDRTIMMNKGEIIDDIPLSQKRLSTVDDLFGTLCRTA